MKPVSVAGKRILGKIGRSELISHKKVTQIFNLKMTAGSEWAKGAALGAGVGFAIGYFYCQRNNRAIREGITPPSVRPSTLYACSSSCKILSFVHTAFVLSIPQSSRCSRRYNYGMAMSQWVS
jgi:hypothetical protein